MLGRSQEELVGRHWSEFATQSAVIAWEERMGKIETGEKVSSLYEDEVVHKDGRIVPMELVSRVVCDAKGKSTGVQVISRDITERKVASEELNLRTQEMEALFNIANVLVQPGAFEEKAKQVLEEVVRVAGADWATFRQRDEERQGLQLVAAARSGETRMLRYGPGS